MSGQGGFEVLRVMESLGCLVVWRVVRLEGGVGECCCGFRGVGCQ